VRWSVDIWICNKEFQRFIFSSQDLVGATVLYFCIPYTLVISCICIEVTLCHVWVLCNQQYVYVYVNSFSVLTKVSRCSVINCVRCFLSNPSNVIIYNRLWAQSKLYNK
jgi:hypothetical protein